jgi:hypothetical protein
MYLVLCAGADVPAQWAYRGLLEAGVRPIELVTAEDLGVARTWEFRMGADGARLNIELNDGRVVCSSRIKGVLNRLVSPPEDVIKRAVADDRDYVLGELIAFYLSWLNSLPGVINRPTPYGLCGGWRHMSEWVILAARAGLPTPPYRQSGAQRPEDGYASLAPPGSATTSVIVLRGDLYGPAVPPEVAQRCQQLAAGADADLLGIELFDSGTDPLTFAHATPLPDLTAGGPDLIEGLARAWQGAGAR